jgi:hypothetical protein
VSLADAPTWLLGALLALLVMILLGPDRTYQRALTLLRALRGTDPPAPERDTQTSGDQPS